MKIAILGAGQMGAGIAYLLGRKGCRINLWDRSRAVLDPLRVTKESPHLPGIKIQGNVEIFSDLGEAIKGADLMVLAVPSFAVREMCESLAFRKNSLPPLLMISKGIEKETARLPFQIAEEVLGEQDILHISGVGYPKEIEKGLPVTEVLASNNTSLLNEVKTLFETKWLRVQMSSDLLGVQLAGALKNVMVIAFGMITASEQPEHKKELISKLISLGVGEMKKLGKVMGDEEETFDGPAGRGDLEFSADPLSRNFRLGESIFRQGIEQVKKDLQKNKKTVEGLLSSYAAYKLAEKYGLNLPIIKSVYMVIYEGADAKSARKLIDS